MKGLSVHLLNLFVAFIIALAFTVVFHTFGVKSGITVVFFGILIASFIVLHYWAEKCPCCS